MDVATITLPPSLELKIDLTDEQFFQLCQNNRDLRFERTAKGELIIMPPTGSDTDRRCIKIAFQLEAWSRQNNLGVAFGSSTGFKLPSGTDRSPDASWVRRDCAKRSARGNRARCFNPPTARKICSSVS